MSKTPNLDLKTEYYSEFELVINVRDIHGKPTGRFKSIVHSDPAKLDNFYHKNAEWTWDPKNWEWTPRISRRRRRGGNKS